MVRRWLIEETAQGATGREVVLLDRPERASAIASPLAWRILQELAKELGVRPRIEFGVLAAVVEAAERGVSVLLLLPEDRVAEAVRTIEAANARLEDKIPYESTTLG